VSAGWLAGWLHVLFMKFRTPLFFVYEIFFGLAPGGDDTFENVRYGKKKRNAPGTNEGSQVN
jgi:hypothetical protein